MEKVLLNLSPIAPARWETHPDTGAKFNIAPLPAERDAELQRKCSDLAGNLDTQSFNAKVCEEVIKGWEGLGEKNAVVPCNVENIKTFARHHGQGIGYWVLRKARSLQHYVQQEEAAAKKG